MKGEFSTPFSPWENLVTWISLNWKGKSLLVKLWKLCLSITVYHLWRERNRRYHTQRSMDVREMFASIVEEV